VDDAENGILQRCGSWQTKEGEGPSTGISGGGKCLFPGKHVVFRERGRLVLKTLRDNTARDSKGHNGHPRKEQIVGQPSNKQEEVKGEVQTILERGMKKSRNSIRRSS